ncbi:hypothetical protein ACTFIV_010078 [Dictyostelium citrinum]
MIKFFTILFIYFLLNATNGLTLENSERQCLDNLLSNLGLNTSLDCSNNTIVQCSIYNQRTFVVGLNLISQNVSHEISQSDLECFSKVAQIVIKDSKVSSSFLTGPFPTIFSIVLTNNTIAYDQLFSTPISTNLTLLYVTDIPPLSSTVNINLSYIQKLTYFQFQFKNWDQSTKWISLINDFPSGGMYNFPSLAVDLKDIPPMDNIKCESITFRTYSSPMSLGYSNIPTLVNIKSIYLYISTGTSDFTQFSLIPKNNLLKTIFINGPLTLTTKADLTNLTALYYLDLRNVLSNFNYQGQIPLILPESVTTLVIGGSSFSNGVYEFIEDYPNISYLSLSYNQITGNFSQWKNRGYLNFLINNNKLQGSVDPSWCTTLLFFSNNQLSGELPSCYTCHLLNSEVKSLVYGSSGTVDLNSFTNVNPIPTCTTLIPNLRYNSTSSQLILYGDDLGFYPSNVKVQGYFFNNKIPSKLFVADSVSQSNLPQFLDFNFPGANKVFTLSTIQKAPIVNTITASAQSNSIILEGSFFNYNTSSIKIVIGDNNQCSIVTTTFYKVECLMLGVYEKNTVAKVTINIRDYYYLNLQILETSVLAYLNQTTQIQNCQQDCIPRGGFCNTLIGQCILQCPNNCTNSLSGTCNTSTGNCICNPDYQGLDCSIPFKSCPSNCNSQSNQGTCNNQTGTCQCSSNYQGLDCSLPYIPCTSDCSAPLNQGSCNNQTGFCICISSHQGADCSLPLIPCPTFKLLPCNGGSNICQNQTGTCQCSSNYQGLDCSIPFKPCSSDCGAPLNQGSCNNQTGTCQCSSNYQGLDCSIPYIPCTSDCSAPLNQGSCNNQTGVCKCISNYQGSDCTTPSHYITSVIPCSIDGGEVSINGWFGNDQDGTHTLSSYNVLIGNLNCIVTSINQSTIQCNLGAGTGTKNIKITNSVHSNVVFNGNGLFNYQNPIKSCPNSCTSLNNGKCNSNTGECQCNDKFRGFDCSTPITIIETAPTTNTLIDKDTGGTSLINQDTIYEISIISLNEISIDGSIIKSHPLKENWSIDNDNQETSNSNIFKFSQQLINNTCTITYTIEEIKLKDKSFTFGTTTFTVEKDSIKLSVLVKDYQYQSALNTLQLVFYSAANSNNNNSNNGNNDCNKQETSIDTSNANNQQVSNYIQISKNSKTLVGRFINQVIADSRPTFMSSTIINDNNNNDKSTSSIKIGLNLPHCNECLIDPDFSILVSPDFKDSCDQSSNKNKWLIPVAVVVPVVGCAAIAVISIVVYKKNRYTIKLFKLKTFKK